MTSISTSIQQIFAASGHKLTAPRERVLAWIAKHGKIFSAKEIRRDIAVDKVSLYRTLDLLRDMDAIHPVLSLHGELHYEVHEHGTHHHHIVCTVCEQAQCIPCVIKEPQVAGFHQVHHSYSLTGTCAACQ